MLQCEDHSYQLNTVYNTSSRQKRSTAF